MTSVIALFLAALGLTSAAVLGLLYHDLAERIDGALFDENRRRGKAAEALRVSLDRLAAQTSKELADVERRVSDLKTSHEAAVEWLFDLQHSSQSVLVAARRFGLALTPDEVKCDAGTPEVR